MKKISSTPLVHRKETLDAISKKAHHINARIELLKTDAQKMQQMLNQIPEETGSRLDWLNKNLSNF